MRKCVGLVLILFFLAGFCTGASAKDYSLEKAEVYYTIHEDGLVEAVEEITFRFSGDFTFAYRDIPKGEWQLSELQVLEAGIPLQVQLTNRGNDTRVTWYYKASNETKTFTIKYKLAKAVTAYSDVAEFYWKVWGSGWEKPLKELYGEIELPAAVENPEAVYSWGHPEINGKIGLVDNQKLIFQAFGIPAGQWIEIRMLFPRELLSSTEFAQVKRQT